MPLEIIRGAIGAGKSEACYERIEAYMKTGACKKAIVVVPDQCSFNTEKRLAERFGGLGLNGIEVMTYTRLIHRFGEKPPQDYLTPAGKQMLIYRAVLGQSGEGNMFSESFKKPGFLDAVADMISEFKRYGITPELLLKQASCMEHEMLKQKLTALSAIYRDYLLLTDGKFSDSEDDLPALAAYIEAENLFADTSFWFDEFSDFLPHHYTLIKALINKAQSVHVTLALPKNADAGVYEVPLATQRRLYHCCTESELTVTDLDGSCRHIESDEIRFFVENYNKWNKVYPEKTGHVCLFCARDLYGEVEHLAGKIMELIRQGYRYRDISILCGKEERYSHIIEAVFRDYHIPYYTDLQRAVTDHPLIVLVLAMFEIHANNWSYDAVFRYLRGGFLYRKLEDGSISRFPEEDIDLLENYVLKHGIRGKKAWFTPWEEEQGGAFGGVLEGASLQAAKDLEALNETRAAILAPIATFLEKTKGRCSARTLSKALFEFLEDIYLFEGLQLEIKEANAEGRRNEAEQLGLVWNLLVDLLDQVVVTMGDDHCSKDDFGMYLRAGLSKSKLSIIPSGLDCVTIGAPDRSRQQHTDVIFVLGAVQGELPAELASEGLLSNADRAILKDVLAEDGVELALDTREKMSAESYKIFRSVAAAKKRLYVSYPMMDSAQTTLRPAQLVWDLMRTFKQLQVTDDVITADIKPIYTPKQLVQYLLSHPEDGATQEADTWLSGQEFWQERIKLVEQIRAHQKLTPRITPEDADLLYGQNTQYSVTRLNEFGKCPFGYFLKYGLRAKEQEIWQIQKFELGSLMHWVVCEYCKAVDRDAQSLAELKQRWQDLTPEENEKIIIAVMIDAEKRILKALKHDRGKVEYFLLRTKKTLIRSAGLIRKSIAAGDYAAICYEQDFKVHIGWQDDRITLTGTIDRIDMAETDGMLDLRVVDYKSGKKDFSLVSIYHKQDMQLVVYAIAVLELYRQGALRFYRQDRDAQVSGVLYNKLRDELTTVQGTEQEAAALAGEETKVDGLVVLDAEDGVYDPEGLRRMEHDLAAGQRSSFMKLKLKQDGMPDAHAKVANREQFRLLMDYVKKAAVDADRRIKNGDIDIAPYCDTDSSACKFCAFGEICQNRDDGEAAEKPGKAIWDRMREGVES